MKDTLRYKNKVAALKSQPAHVKEAALFQAIAVGTQWKMDAVLEAIDSNPQDWNFINNREVFKHAAMYGRLEIIQAMSRSAFFEYDPKKKRGGVSDDLNQAFDTAVIHGHYAVADYCASLGASPELMIDSTQSPRAMYVAIKAGDETKVDYLIAHGSDPSYYLINTVASGNIKMVDLLLSRGADVNCESDGFYTPFLTAIQYSNNEMAKHLLTKGADPTNKKSSGEVLYAAVARNNIEMVEVILNLGIKPGQNDLDLAKNDKQNEIVALLEKNMPTQPRAAAPRM